METITFGYGKTYAWDDHGTSSNLQNTNMTTLAGSDGWKVLAFSSPTWSDTFDADFTGWTENNIGTADSSISGNCLYQNSGGGGGHQTQLYQDGVTSNDTTSSLFVLSKLPVIEDYTDTSSYWGYVFRYFDGTRGHYVNIRKDTTYLDVYFETGDGLAFAKHDTTIAAETSRFHIMGLSNNNAANATVFNYDGNDVITNGENYALASNQVMIATRYGNDNCTSYTRWVKYFNSITPWETTDGTWTSTDTDTLFDAGNGFKWFSVTYTGDTSNSTGLTFQKKTADILGNLSGATAGTVTSGSRFSDGELNRAIQIIATLSDASSGRYTSILKDMTLTKTPVPLDEASWPGILCKCQSSLGSIEGHGDEAGGEGYPGVTDIYGNLLIRAY